MRPGFAAPFILLLLCIFAFTGEGYGRNMRNSAQQQDTTKKERPKRTNACTAIGNLTGTTCIGSELKASVSTEAFAPIAMAQWFTGNNTLVLTQSAGPFVYTPPVTGTYYVKITTTEGCQVTTNSVTISALKEPLIKITTPSNVVCADFPTPSFTGVPTYNGEHPTYQWKVNGMAVGPVVTEVLTPFKPIGLKKGDKVTCEMTSSDDCITRPVVESAPIFIEDVPNQNPSATIALLTTTPCEGSALTFEAFPINTGNVTVYLWFVNGVGAGNGDKKTFTSSNLKDGDEVSCTVISTAKVCQSFTSFMSDPLTVHFTPTVTPEISIASVTAEIDVSVTYKATIKHGGSAPNYQWHINGQNVGTNADTYTAYKLTPGDVLTCTLTSNVDCTLSNTITSDPLTNNVTLPVRRVIVNMFTPNGDGVNDTWAFPGVDAFRNAKVSVYNRYGKIVFNSTGFIVQWDGKTNAGGPCPSGVYYYFINFGQSKTQAGSVTIIR
ncbi:gliding motility-associated C-terminal domain-containing protein [Mucilaginibacter pedocola]|uniref:Ig-like domain-containing protein n=1 Tax=Mucilaginibacter pedocola TaxID=1792845 RepID=A0A1S9PHU7_9SPHI|nr:gliding motility-associated C-terminal domain-containing protein [Mucilaginibacter pedocola]OOQ60534.1 hypothetical protein BC343_24910 [Mucilaginibacter pedocola]